MDSTFSLSTTKMALSSSTLSHFTSRNFLHRSLKCFAYNHGIPTSPFLASSASSTSLRSFSALAPSIRCRLRCVSASAASSDANSEGAEELLPQVSSASVNLTTETAIVWPVSEAKAASNWKKQLGGALAEHLTSCGFKSSLRGQEDSN